MSPLAPAETAREDVGNALQIVLTRLTDWRERVEHEWEDAGAATVQDLEAVAQRLRRALTKLDEEARAG